MEPVQQAVALARRTGQVLLASTDEQGLPHISVGTCTHVSGLELTVSEWFCPRTLQNIAQNPHVAVVVWDPVSDTGFQMLGRVEAVNELHILGCTALPANEARADASSPPASEHALLIAVERVLDFCRAPHADRPVRPPTPRREATPHPPGGPRAVRASVDRAVCIGAASCVGIAPQYFVLDPDGLAHFSADDIPLADEALLREAAASCPVQAIILFDANGHPIDLQGASGA